LMLMFFIEIRRKSNNLTRLDSKNGFTRPALNLSFDTL
jgi:hypothetical protein